MRDVRVKRTGERCRWFIIKSKHTQAHSHARTLECCLSIVRDIDSSATLEQSLAVFSSFLSEDVCLRSVRSCFSSSGQTERQRDSVCAREREFITAHDVYIDTGAHIDTHGIGIKFTYYAHIYSLHTYIHLT
jgi:hypothetical protein